MQPNSETPGRSENKHRGVESPLGKAATLTQLLKDEQERAAEITRTWGQKTQGSVQSEVVEDCLELLKLFGIPYVIAPFEAEAQCAYLNLNGVVDAVISDDSDTLLFGATVVYRKVFSEEGPEKYEATRIEETMKLRRTDLVDLALLLGSDYTDGICGVGPVLGMEILAHFRRPGADTLLNWRRFVVEDPPDSPLRHITKLKGFRLPDSFPSPAVRQGYFNPVVSSISPKTKFVWKTPDLEKIRLFARTQLYGLRPNQVQMHLDGLSNSVQTTQNQLTITSLLRAPQPLHYPRSVRIDGAINSLASSLV